MKKFGIVSFVFLLTLTGCSSVKAYEKQIGDASQKFLDGMSEGYTIDASVSEEDNKTITLVSTVDTLELDINHTDTGTVDKIVDDAQNNLSICSNDVCNEELTGNLKDLYDSAAVTTDENGAYKVSVNTGIEDTVQGMNDIVSGNYRNNGATNEEGVHSVSYTDSENTTVIYGVNTEDEKLVMDITLDDGSTGTLSFYLNK